MTYTVIKVIDSYTYLVENGDTQVVVFRKDFIKDPLSRSLFVGEQVKLDLYALKDRNGIEVFVARNVELLSA